MTKDEDENEYSWSPLFAGLPVIPQTGKMVALAPQESGLSAGKPRRVEDLADTCWRIVESRPEGLVLRDGPPDHWYEETIWCPGRTPGRTYAIRWQGQEYEFRCQVATWNPNAHDPRKAKIRRRPVAA